MKLSMDTSTLRERIGLEATIKMVKEAGIDRICFDSPWPDEEPEFIQDPKAYAKKIKACLDEYGVQCRQAHATIGMQYGYAFDESEEQYKNIIRGIEAAAVLGAKYIVVHPIRIPSDAPMTFEEYNREFFKTLIPHCEKNKIQIAIENLYKRDEKCGCYRGVTQSPKDLCNFIKSLNSEWFVACVDVGHAALTGVEPEDYIRGMDKGLTKIVHMHDVDYIADRHTLPYSYANGLNWDNIMAALKEIEYDEDFNYEICTYINRFPTELLPATLKHANEVGRYLISKFEK